MTRQKSGSEPNDMPTQSTTITPQQAVQAERHRRALSIRQAARMADVSNTHWGDMEAGRAPLTGRMRQAVATAFDWPLDWPETMTAPPDSSVIQRLEALETATARLAVAVEPLTRALEPQPEGSGE
jgi:hypothetical protein